MPNINFNPSMDEYDLQKPVKAETPKEPEWAKALREEREAHQRQLADQAAHTNRKLSEMYEQSQLQNRAMLEMLKKNNPEPDYSDNDSYFKDSYDTENSTVDPEEIKRLAREAAEETLRDTVTRGTQVQQYRSQREQELAKQFQEHHEDLHPHQQKVYALYQQAQQNFPQASPDDQFGWAVSTARNLLSDVTPKQEKKQKSPVGRYGNKGYADQVPDHVREIPVRDDREIMSEYYNELSEFEQELDSIFDG